MRINLIPCGEAVNESEAAAIDRLNRELQKIGGDDEWILLTNLAFSVTHQFQSDEIDIIVIGPPGVRVIEVKHWSVGWVDANSELVGQEADKLTNKARKVGTTAAFDRSMHLRVLSDVLHALDYAHNKRGLDGTIHRSFQALSGRGS